MVTISVHTHVLIGTEYHVVPPARSLSPFQLPLCWFFYFVHVHWLPISVALACLSSFIWRISAWTTPRFSVLLFFPNFLCGCFLVLGPLLLLYQLYLHVSPLFCLMAPIPADHFQFLPPVSPVSYIYQYLNCDIFLHKETYISYFVSFKLTMDRLNFILF